MHLILLFALLLTPKFALAWKSPPPVPAETLKHSLARAFDYLSQVIIGPGELARGDYHVQEKRWIEYEPFWHSGQSIRAMVEYHLLTAHQEPLASALYIARTLSTFEENRHPTLMGLINSPHDGYLEHLMRMATITNGTPGFFRLAQVVKMPHLAERLERSGEWFLKHLFDPDTQWFYDYIDTKTGEPIRSLNQVPPVMAPQLEGLLRPNIEGSFFRDLYVLTQNPRYKDAFLRSCAATVKDQHADGIWWGHNPNAERERYVHQRFNIWYADAMLDCFALSREAQYLIAAQRTAKRYKQAQLKDGLLAFRQADGKFPLKDSVCGSCLAFTAKFWLRLQQLTGDPQYEGAIHRAAHWIVKNQYPEVEADPNLRHAYKDHKIKRGKNPYTLQRDLGTIFGLQFLIDYSRWQYPSRLAQYSLER